MHCHRESVMAVFALSENKALVTRSQVSRCNVVFIRMATIRFGEARILHVSAMRHGAFLPNHVASRIDFAKRTKLRFALGDVFIVPRS
mmetsp:Transcript_40085/g.123852  ORF Transcript_40085/g.123852 Transcript_40085/m.123852 type:complete len:88 (+) Transcript_40085:270-533(+)